MSRKEMQRGGGMSRSSTIKKEEDEPSSDPSPSPKPRSYRGSGSSVLDTHLTATDFPDRICLVRTGNGGDRKLWPALRFHSMTQLMSQLDTPKTKKFKLALTVAGDGIAPGGRVAYLLGWGMVRESLVPLPGGDAVEVDFAMHVHGLRCQPEYKADARWGRAYEIAMNRAKGIDTDSDGEPPGAVADLWGQSSTASDRGMGKFEDIMDLCSSSDDEEPSYKKNANNKWGDQDENRKRKKIVAEQEESQESNLRLSSDDEKPSSEESVKSKWGDKLEKTKRGKAAPEPVESGGSNLRLSINAEKPSQKRFKGSEGDWGENRTREKSNSRQRKSGGPSLCSPSDYGTSKRKKNATSECGVQMEREEDNPEQKKGGISNMMALLDLPVSGDGRKSNPISTEGGRTTPSCLAEHRGSPFDPSSYEPEDQVSSEKGQDDGKKKAGYNKGKRRISLGPDGAMPFIARNGSKRHDSAGGVNFAIECVGKAERFNQCAMIDLTGNDSDEGRQMAERNWVGGINSEGEDSGEDARIGDATKMSKDAHPIRYSADNGDVMAFIPSSGGECAQSSLTNNEPTKGRKVTPMNKMVPPQCSHKEVGYLLVNDCDVLIPADAPSVAFSSLEWQNVYLQPNSNSGIVVDGGKDLILEPADEENSPVNNPSWRSVNDITHFSGLTSEINSSDDPKCRRSDASLLAGLAVAINQEADGNVMHFRNLRMEKMQLFWDKSQCLITTSRQWSRMNASLLMTFSLPIPTIDGIGARPDMALECHPDERLPSAHKLIGSIIRCDWDHLDKMKKMLEQKARKLQEIAGNSESIYLSRGQMKKEPFFPAMMTVKDIYHRISSTGDEERTIMSARGEIQGLTLDLFGLNEDIISASIAPYLRARSLHALRVTNSKMYETLREVSPGLKLKLFPHQVHSLEMMEMREWRRITEEDVLSRYSRSLSGGWKFLRNREAACGGDYHRAVTGGATVLLRPRTFCGSGDAHGSPIRFDSESGDPWSSSSDCKVRRTCCARGGLLCDDPGLGKTITVISLILRTFGLGTTSTEAAYHAKNDNELFYSYWHSSELSEKDKRQKLLMINTLLQNSEPDDSREVEYYLRLLQDVRSKYDDDSKCGNFEAFEADVRRCFSDVPDGYSKASERLRKNFDEASKRLRKNFDELLSDFKSEQIKLADKHISHMTAKDEGSRPLVDLFEARKKREIQQRLIKSSSTLLVVPDTLLKHWEEQMMLHVDFSYLSSGDSPIMVYFHTSNRDIQFDDARMSADLGRVKDPILFIDDGTRPLPSPDEIARFPIVLTSHGRCRREREYGGKEESIKASPLLKISWLRVIVDEGHKMGGKMTNLNQFSSWIIAQNRWAMTGTPTPEVTNQNGLTQLYDLARFVNHEFFTKELGRDKVWSQFIQDGWDCNSLASFFRLKHTLSYLMVRHSKGDSIEIPSPLFSETSVELSQQEVTSYNTIVSDIRSNIITNTMGGKTPVRQNCLLNPKCSKLKKYLRHLRISCYGGYRILPELSYMRDNALKLLRGTHMLDEDSVKIVIDFFRRSQNFELTSCHKCGINLQILLIIPCGHLVCTECIDNKTTSCPVCLKEFDIDDFQRLQPSEPIFDLDNLEAHADRPVGWDPRSHKKGESCVYSPHKRDGKCTICRAEHSECNFLAKDNGQCPVCFRFAEECPDDASKAKYVIKKLLRLHSDYSLNHSMSPMAAQLPGGSASNNPRDRPLKAVIFSEEHVTYHYFGDPLIRRFGRACVAQYSEAKTRTKELQKFIHQPECFIMLLSKLGAEGLDLSFVTHIFFLDPLYDKSLESQVVARAYRTRDRLEEYRRRAIPVPFRSFNFERIEVVRPFYRSSLYVRLG